MYNICVQDFTGLYVQVDVCVCICKCLYMHVGVTHVNLHVEVSGKFQILDFVYFITPFFVLF